MTPHKFDWAVCIGRFQLFHDAQLALVRVALRLAPRCAIVIGSAHQARSPRNPFTWEERAGAIRLALGEEERARVAFLPVRDTYDEKRWVAAVPEGRDEPRITLTYPALECSELILFLVAGAAKRDALAQARGGALPAGGIRPQGDVLWLADAAAAGAEDQGYGF